MRRQKKIVLYYREKKEPSQELLDIIEIYCQIEIILTGLLSEDFD